MATYLILTLFLSSIPTLCLGQDEIQLSYDISENLGQFTYVGDVATDSQVQTLVQPEEVSSLEFAILTPATTDPKKYFTVDTQTGVLRTDKVIDRDVICKQEVVCKLVIRVAVVSTKSNFFKIIRVTVNVIDANDNPPKFTSSTFTKSIPENTPVMSSISIPAANDPDSPQYGISHYSVISSVPEFSLKQVNNTDGTVALYLVVKKRLDREVKDFYRVVVTAFDKGNQSGTLTVDIKILDINDNQPTFTPSEYSTNVDEDMKPGSIVIQVIAQDQDLGLNSELVYDFDAKTKADFGSVFGINNTSGEISLQTKLDYEQKKSYSLVLTAKELHHETIPAEAKVVVNVNDKNDNPPKITTSSLSPNVEVIENAPVGTFIAHLNIQDPDTGRGGRFTCQLKDNQDNRFKLDAINPDRTEFKISTNYMFNREQQDQYTLQFVCTDQGFPALTSTATIRVTILDENDNAPKFTQQIYEVQVSENNPKGLFLTQVKATDPDFGANGQIEYSLYTEAMSYIHVDPKSGNITANEIFDYEKYHTLSFGIIAKDKGEDSHQTTAILNIKIINENDEPPAFSTLHFHFNVNETRPPFTKIGKLTIKERDPALNNVTFAFAENSEHRDLFSIDPKTGNVYTKKSFDADDNTAHFFELEVRVLDSVHTNLQSGAVVSVTVVDLNDNRPDVSFPNAVNDTISVASDFPKGQVITTCKGSDRDSGLNADLGYMIESGNNDHYFSLAENSGELRTMRPLSHIKQRTFILTISVHDKGNPPLANVKTLKINVNSTLSATSPVKSDLVESNNLTIVIVVAVISAILIIALVASIVVLQRKDKIRFRQKQRRMSKLLYDQKAIVVQQTRTPDSFDSVDKPYLGKDVGYNNDVNTSDEFPSDYQIGYPIDKKSGSRHKDEESGSQLSDQSGADSGRGSNDDPDLTASHMSILQGSTQPSTTRILYSNNTRPPATIQTRDLYANQNSTSPVSVHNNHHPKRTGSYSNHTTKPPVIPERTHKSHMNNKIDTRGYMELPVTRINNAGNNNMSSSSHKDVTDFNRPGYRSDGPSNSYLPSDNDSRRTPPHSDESYVVSPNPSYI